MTGSAPVAPVPVPLQPTQPAPASVVPAPPAAHEPVPPPPPPKAESTDDDGVSRGDSVDEDSEPDPHATGAPPDPFDPGSWPDPYAEGAQPDPFAEATTERRPSGGDGASVAPRRPPGARASAEALAEAAAGDRLELLRSVFPGRVLRLVPDAAPGGAGDRAPGLGAADLEPLDASTDAADIDIDTDPNEPGGSA